MSEGQEAFYLADSRAEQLAQKILSEGIVKESDLTEEELKYFRISLSDPKSLDLITRSDLWLPWWREKETSLDEADVLPGRGSHVCCSDSITVAPTVFQDVVFFCSTYITLAEYFRGDWACVGKPVPSKFAELFCLALSPILSRSPGTPPPASFEKWLAQFLSNSDSDIGQIAPTLARVEGVRLVGNILRRKSDILRLLNECLVLMRSASKRTENRIDAFLILRKRIEFWISFVDHHCENRHNSSGERSTMWVLERAADELVNLVDIVSREVDAIT